MLLLNEKSIKQLGYQWHDTIQIITIAVECMAVGDYVQPLKPYLRFGDTTNRIIAMPAYLGGTIHKAGLKWIASFPHNLDVQLPRASSITILNAPDTGLPLAILTTPLISIIRTVSVSGYILQRYLELRPKPQYNIGIVGWGPIGQNHLQMCQALLGDKVGDIYVYDVRPCDMDDTYIHVSASWQEVYDQADIFITCTSSLDRYIHLPVQSPKLVLDISLRDFCDGALDSFTRPFLVDDWHEVNRENTDIEYYAQLGKLCAEDTLPLSALCHQSLTDFFTPEDTVFFAPMGMGIFDLAIANYFYNMAVSHHVGLHIDC